MAFWPDYSQIGVAVKVELGPDVDFRLYRPPCLLSSRLETEGAERRGEAEGTKHYDRVPRARLS